MALGQDRYIVTCYSAGDCNNMMVADNLIDSIFESKNIRHRYKLTGIKKEEIEKYSKVIFGKYIDPKKVLSESDINEYKLQDLKPGFVAYICNKEILLNCNFWELPEKTSYIFAMNCDSKKLFRQTGIKQVLDSFSLNFSKKTLITNFRNGNTSTYVIDGNFLYGTDPLFERTLVKIDITTGKTIIKKNINEDIKPIDIYKAAYPNFIFIDTLMKYDNLLNQDERLIIEKLFTHNNRYFLIAHYEMFTYNNESKDFIPLSHNLIIEYDSLLNFVSFFIDPLISYSKMYPQLGANTFLINDSLLLGQFIHDDNIILKKKYLMYFNLKNNLIKKNAIDSVELPKSLNGIFESNIIGTFTNINNIENPIFSLFPAPYLYFRKTKSYLNLITDSTYTIDSIYTKFLKFRIIATTKLNNDETIILYEYDKNLFYSQLNLRNQKNRLLKSFGNLSKFGLQLILSTEGKLYCFPINNTDKDNYLYELN